MRNAATLVTAPMEHDALTCCNMHWLLNPPLERVLDDDRG
jgi:hypothetical protein